MRKIRLPIRDKNVFINLVDARDGMRITTLAGKIKLPLTVCFEGTLLRWGVEGLKEKAPGVVTDVGPDTIQITFPFIERKDGIGSRGEDLSPLDIANLFMRFEPRLKVIKIK